MYIYAFESEMCYMYIYVYMSQDLLPPSVIKSQPLNLTHQMARNISYNTK